ncbi:MAG: NAD(P)-dependent dehydrogenase (short-subunit alcohol dehydrogenase family) [Candidatus Azotimanducaceae bacterium]|jgi:NAD(P)-dependent dehydrogenase (short-subunit alcohol dehydrogenase family)
MVDLANKVAVITGGASGIGEGTARKFVAAGARCVIADLQLERAEAIAAELGDACIATSADVAKEEDVARIVDLAVDHFGSLDIMFNNAGILGSVGPIAEISAEGWHRTIDVLLSSVFFGIKHAARVMIPRGGGVIINTASTAGVRAGLGPHIYTAAKHGVIGLSQSVAAELGPKGIRCNIVCPGGTVTGLTARLAVGDHNNLEEATKVIGVANPMGRGGRVEDIANAVAFLSSEDAGFVNGAVFVVDGGGEVIGDRSGRFVDMGAITVQEADRTGV